MKKQFIIAILCMVISLSFVSAVSDNDVKYVLKKVLFEQYANPDNTTLTLPETVDLLVFYLNSSANGTGEIVFPEGIEDMRTPVRVAYAKAILSFTDKDIRRGGLGAFIGRGDTSMFMRDGTNPNSNKNNKSRDDCIRGRVCGANNLTSAFLNANCSLTDVVVCKEGCNADNGQCNGVIPIINNTYNNNSINNNNNNNGDDVINNTINDTNDCVTGGCMPSTQYIPLTIGWNIVSFNVKPADLSVNAVFAGMNPVAGEVIINEDDVRVDYINGTWVGGFTRIDLSKGYKVSVKSNKTLVVSGVPISPSTDVVLRSGWNIIPYYPTTEMNAVAVFDSIRSCLKKVQDEAGNAYEDWGAFGGWHDSIGMLQPGEGYKVQTTDVCTLNYNNLCTNDCQKIGQNISNGMDMATCGQFDSDYCLEYGTVINSTPNICVGSECVSQSITLYQGWNIVSFNVKPADLSVNAVFAGMNPVAGEVIINEDDVRVDYINGTWVGGFTRIDLSKGYKVSVKSNKTLVVSGVPISPSTDVVLRSGWNIIPYYSTTEMNAVAVFDSIRSCLKKVMDEEGNAYEDWGAFGGWHDSIGMLQPGEGYKVQTTDVCTLNYNNLCTNDCYRAGQTTCDETSVKTCGQYDSDYCLEYGALTSCTNGCTNGTCTVIIPDVCVDSDQGLNYNSVGTVMMDGNSTGTDYCPTSEVLVEFYCLNGFPTASPYNCTCNNGVCV